MYANQHTADSIRLAYSVNDSCFKLGIGRSKVYDLIKAGELKTIKLGRHTLITAASLHALVEAKAA